MPQKELRTLKEKLLRATACIKQRPDPSLEQADYAFSTVFIDPDDDTQDGVDEIEVRDAFLEFMSKIMSDYRKFFKDIHDDDGTVPDRVNSRDCFCFSKFRAQKDGTKPDSFIYKFTESAIFGNCIESRSLGTTEHDEQIIFFDEIQKQQRTKQRQFLVEPFKEKKAVKTMAPSEEGLEPSNTYTYQIFPEKFET